MKAINAVAIAFAMLFAAMLSASPVFATSGWSPALEAQVSSDEALAREWAASIGAPAPTFRHVTKPSQGCIVAPAKYCYDDKVIYIAPIGVTQWSAGQMGSKFTVGHETAHRFQPSFSSNANELQADCGSGVFIRWLKDRGVVTDADVSYLQRRLTATIIPDSLNGTAADRVGAFRHGYDGVQLSSCNSFSGHLQGT